MDARDVMLAIASKASEQDLDGIQKLTQHDRVTESFRRLLTAFPDANVEVEWVIAEGNRAAGFARITGTHRGEWRGLAPTGRPIDVRGMLAVQVRPDGTVEDFWVANDWLSIATQIGVELKLPGR